MPLSREFPIKFEVLFVAALFLFVTFAATYRLTESPATWYDEGYLLQTSKNLTLYGKQELQMAPDVFVSTASVSSGFTIFAPVALSFKLFGIGLLQARLVMVLYILAFCAAAYALMRGLFGPWTAPWSLVALAGFAELYGNGKAVLGEVPGLFFLMLTLFLIHRLEKSGYTDVRLYALSGLAAGLCIITKPIFILFLPAAGLVYLLRFRSIRVRFRGFIASIAAFLLPVFVWAYMQFGADASLWSVLNFYANPYDAGAPAFALVNIKRFLTELTPLYTLLLTGVWAAALFVRRKTVTSTELAAFFFCILVLLAYLRVPGWYRYLFPGTMMALVFLAPSAFAVYGKCADVLKIFRRLPLVPHVLIALLFVAQTFQLFTTSYVAGYFNGSRTRDLQTYVGGLPKDASVYFYNVPEAAFFAPSDRYYQYIDPKHSFGLYGTDTLSQIAEGAVDYVVLTAGVVPDVDLSKYRPVQNANRYTILQKK